MNFCSIVLFLCFTYGLQAGGWSTPVTLSSEGSTYPFVAMDSNGMAVCVWQNTDGVQAAICPANGSWGATSTISATSEITNVPVVYDYPNGDMVAFWASSNEIQYATLPAGAKSWNISSQPFATSNGELSTPVISFDSQGNGLAVWSDTTGEGDAETTLLKTARFVAGSGSWQTLEDLEQSYETEGVAVGFDQEGNALMTWKHYTNSDYTVVEILSAELGAGDTSWASSESIYNKFGNVISETVFDEVDYAVTLWNSGGPINALTYTFGDSGWQETTFPKSFTIHSASLALNPKDKSAAVVWIDLTTNTIYCSQLTKSNSTWSAPTTLFRAPADSNLWDQSLQFDSLGNAVAIWTDNTQNVLQAATQSYGKPWSKAATISPFVRHNMFPNWSGWPSLALCNGAAVVAFPQWINESADGIQAVTK